MQGFRPRLPPEAINFLTVHTKDAAQIAVPPENRAEHVVKFVERHLIGDRDQADGHPAHLAQNSSQNQAFERGCFTILQTTRIARPPTFWRSRFKHSATTAVGFCPLAPVGSELCLELGKTGAAWLTATANWGLLARGIE